MSCVLCFWLWTNPLSNGCVLLACRRWLEFCCCFFCTSRGKGSRVDKFEWREFIMLINDIYIVRIYIYIYIWGFVISFKYFHMAKMTLARGRMMTKRRREIEKDRRKEREMEIKTITQDWKPFHTFAEWTALLCDILQGSPHVSHNTSFNGWTQATPL